MTTKFVTVLDKIGSAFEKFFEKAIPIAEAAEPIVDVAFPFIGPLYNTTVALVKAAEGAAAAAGKQTGTGPQKLALVLTALQPYATQMLQADGVAAPTTAQITNYINSVVAGLNAFATL
jgi:hypothetical protein